MDLSVQELPCQITPHPQISGGRFVDHPECGAALFPKTAAQAVQKTRVVLTASGQICLPILRRCRYTRLERLGGGSRWAV